jgi:transcriptional regulator with XRE-family HTH domain
MSEPKNTTKFNDPTVRRQEIGDELRRLRATARLALREVAHITSLDASYISRIENGKRTPPPADLASLLTAYRADTATRRRLEALAEEADENGWWQKNRTDITERQHTLISLEGKAERIVSFEPVLIPALLQTGDYARAAMREFGMVPESKIEDGMAARFCRHSVLEQWNPPTFVAIIDELVLDRIVSSPAVVREQLDHLVALSQRPRVTIRVVPNSGGHAGAFGSFELIDQPERPSVVFVEQATSNLFIEQRDEVDVYRRIIKRLLDDALDEGESAERIADAATRLDTEERTE